MESLAAHLGDGVTLVSIVDLERQQRHYYLIRGGQHDGASFESMTEFFQYAVKHGLRLPGNEPGWRRH